MKSITSTTTEPNYTGGRSATIAGIIILTLGLLAMIFPLVTGLSVAVVLGVILAGGAVVHGLNAFSAGTVGSMLGQAILAALYAVAGITFILNPVVGLATLTLLVIVFLLADGVVEIAWGLRRRGRPEAVWLLASGGVSLLLAGLLWLGFPSSGGWAIGVLLGVNLVVTGGLMIIIGRGIGGSITPDVPRGSQE